MKADDSYIKARGTDIKAQRHNLRLFYRRLAARPWQALWLALGMTVLAIIPIFNLVNSPVWHRHPWMGWLVGGLALIVAISFFVTALKSWLRPPHQ